MKDPTPSDTPWDSDTDQLFLSLTIRQRKREKTLTVCSVPVVPLKTAMWKSGYDVGNISDGRIQFVLVWREILFVRLVRDKHVFPFVFVVFFKFCNYSLCVLSKLFTSPN